MEHLMTAASSYPALGPVKARRVIGWAGLIAGSVDIIVQAVLFGLKGKSPVYLLQVIAGGLLGMSSFQGGAATAVLGAFFHFLIAFTAAAVFYAASRKLTLLVRQFALAGVLYGDIVYSFMNFVVLPMSAYHVKVAFPSTAVLTKDIALHVLLIGLPISLVVRKYSTKLKQS